MKKKCGLSTSRGGRVLLCLLGALSTGCGDEMDAPAVEAQKLSLSLSAIGRDDSFGDHGTAFVSASAGQSIANAVAVQNGATVVVGNPGSRQAFAVSRFLPDGRLDRAFRGGTVTDLFPSANSDATEVAYQPDGKVVVAGHSSDSQAHHCFAAVRLLTSGAPDFSFGPSQRPLDTDPTFRPVPGVRVCFGGEGWVQAMALQSDGKVLLAGFARPTVSDGLSAGLVRLTSSGALDSSFHGNGFAQRGNPGLIAEALALQSDGSVLVAGHLGDDFAVERYRADGTFDRSFN